VRTAQGVERQRVELDPVVRADLRVALAVNLVEVLQARRRGRVRACPVDLGCRIREGDVEAVSVACVGVLEIT